MHAVFIDPADPPNLIRRSSPFQQYMHAWSTIAVYRFSTYVGPTGATSDVAIRSASTLSLDDVSETSPGLANPREGRDATDTAVLRHDTEIMISPRARPPLVPHTCSR